jgi:hypothetical protein
MHKVQEKLRVSHFAQLPCKPFTVEVADEIEANKIMNILANQHLFLFEQKIIPDYANAITIEMYAEDSDGDGNPGWCDYFNDVEGMDWDEFKDEYLTEDK